MKDLQKVALSDDLLLDDTKQLAIKGGGNGDDPIVLDPPDPPMWPIGWPDW